MQEHQSNQPSREAMIKMIWAYLDKELKPEEIREVENRISSDEVWNLQFTEIAEVHALLGQSELEQPSMRFTRNVMEAITREQIAPATRSYINQNIIRGIGGFFLLLLLGVFIYIIAQLDWSSSSENGRSIISMPDISLGRFFSNTYTNVFLMMNVVLGLYLLDRYLASKRNRESVE